MGEIETRCDVRWELSKKWGALVNWGCSSVGRALDLHSRGLGFNSPQLHIFINFTLTSSQKPRYIFTNIPNNSHIIFYSCSRWSNYTTQ